MTKQFSNYSDLITFTRASGGHALRPVSYGDELVTNHDFSDGSTGWTVQNTDATHTVTFSNGGARFQSDTTSPILEIVSDVVLDSTKIYKLEVVISDVTSGSIKIDGQSVVQLYNSEGTHTAIIKTTSASGNNVIKFYRATANVDITIDSVSVKEVTFDESDGTLTLFEHPDNIPRVEYDADGNRLGLLVEEARTNLLTYSEDFSNAAWTKFPAATVTPSSVTTPDGQQSGFLLEATGTNRLEETPSTTITGTATFSIFAKYDDVPYVQMTILDSSANGQRQWFKIQDGTLGSSAAVGAGKNLDGASITDMNNGFYRLSLSVDGFSGQTARCLIYLARTDSSFDAASGDSAIVFGAQVEAGSFPTSYIKTTGSTATRSADVASIPVADFGYNTAVGSIVAEVGAHNTDSNLAAHYTISKTSIGSEWVASYSSGTVVAFRVREGGSAQGDIDISNDIRTSGAKTGFAFKEDDFAAVVNGGAVSTDTAGSMASGVEELKIAGFGSNPRQLCGHIKSIKFYPRRLTNAQLVNLTS